MRSGGHREFASATVRLRGAIADGSGVAGPSTAKDLLVLARHDNLPQAVEALEELAFESASPPVTTSLLCLSFELRVRSNHWYGFEPARDAAESALKKVEGDADQASLLQALILLAQARNAMALDEFERANGILEPLAAQPIGFVGHMALTQLGLVQAAMGNLDDAESLLVRSLEVQPDIYLRLRGYSRSLYDALLGRRLGKDTRALCEAGFRSLPGV